MTRTREPSVTTVSQRYDWAALSALVDPSPLILETPVGPRVPFETVGAVVGIRVGADVEGAGGLDWSDGVMLGVGALGVGAEVEFLEGGAVSENRGNDIAGGMVREYLGASVGGLAVDGDVTVGALVDAIPVGLGVGGDVVAESPIVVEGLDVGRAVGTSGGLAVAGTKSLKTPSTTKAPEQSSPETPAAVLLQSSSKHPEPSMTRHELHVNSSTLIEQDLSPPGSSMLTV